MKLRYITSSLLSSAAIAATLLLSGCGDKFQEEYPWVVGSQEEMDNEVEDSEGRWDMDILEKELRGAIPLMINYSHEPEGSWQPHVYQYARSNNIDGYAGYWTCTKGTFTYGGALPTLYTYPNDYLGGPVSVSDLFTQSYNAYHYAEDMKDKEDETKTIASKPQWKAIALIIQAYVAHEVVDFIGAAPLNDWRNRSRANSLTYQPGAEVYNQLFDELDEAVKILNQTQPTADELRRVEDIDGEKSISQGDWRRWVKFANSLKLRMALNMVKYDAGIAQQKAEAAVNDPIGVLTEADRDIAYYHISESGCALYFIGNIWYDIRLNANMEVIMKHFQHPLLYRWFDTNPYAIRNKLSGIQAETDVYGVRAGITMTNKNTAAKDKGGYSPFSTLSAEFRNMPQPFLKTAEVLFCMAEGALRGWNMAGRSAQDLYEAGVTYCFTDNGLTADEALEYLAQEDSALPVVDYVDPYDSDNNAAARVKVGVKWNEGDNPELKLEKIITQKWIAAFPLGAEAWTTFRRTGYPRLIPVLVNGMDYMGVDTELQIRRIPQVVQTNNRAEMASLGTAIGGDQADLSIRCFWDVPTETRGEVNPENGLQYVIPHNF